jgi:hypothetical protein
MLLKASIRLPEHALGGYGQRELRDAGRPAGPCRAPTCGPPTCIFMHRNPSLGMPAHAADRALTPDRSDTGNCPTSPRRRALMATDRVIPCLTLWDLTIASTSSDYVCPARRSCLFPRGPSGVCVGQGNHAVAARSVAAARRRFVRLPGRNSVAPLPATTGLTTKFSWSTRPCSSSVWASWP